MRTVWRRAPGQEFEGMKPMTLTRDRSADKPGLHFCCYGCRSGGGTVQNMMVRESSPSRQIRHVSVSCTGCMSDSDQAIDDRVWKAAPQDRCLLFTTPPPLTGLGPLGCSILTSSMSPYDRVFLYGSSIQTASMRAASSLHAALQPTAYNSQMPGPGNH